MIKEHKTLDDFPFSEIIKNDLKREAIKDLLNVYDLEEILKIKLNDEIIGVLNKYIIWKFNIKEEDLKGGA